MTRLIAALLAPVVAWAMRRLATHPALHDAVFRARVAAVAGLVGTAAIALERACEQADPSAPSTLDAMGLRDEFERARGMEYGGGD